jgi:hypothetical protein
VGLIAAIVTTKPEQVAGGGVPIFAAGNPEELENTSFLLEKILDATAHDLGNGSYILVKH